MDLQSIARGTVEWDRLEAVARAVAEREGREAVHVAFLEADNWLSTPLVVDDEFFVKVVSPQNSLVHALLTGARNLGTVTAGTGKLFEHFDSPLEMAEHELAATERMRAVGVPAPEPIDAFEVEGLGVVVLEYIPEYRSLADLSDEAVADRAEELLGNLATLHDAGVLHGDLRAENVLLVEDGTRTDVASNGRADGVLHFIDATTVKEELDIVTDGVPRGVAYDVACALAMLAPRMGDAAAVDAALAAYDPAVVVEAGSFLKFVALRPDHEFDAARLRDQIGSATA
jgi:hypothetical protein